MLVHNTELVQPAVCSVSLVHWHASQKMLRHNQITRWGPSSSLVWFSVTTFAMDRTWKVFWQGSGSMVQVRKKGIRDVGERSGMGDGKNEAREVVFSHIT